MIFDLIRVPHLSATSMSKFHVVRQNCYCRSKFQVVLKLYVTIPSLLTHLVGSFS